MILVESEYAIEELEYPSRSEIPTKMKHKVILGEYINENLKIIDDEALMMIWRCTDTWRWCSNFLFQSEYMKKLSLCKDMKSFIFVDIWVVLWREIVCLNIFGSSPEKSYKRTKIIHLGTIANIECPNRIKVYSLKWLPKIFRTYRKYFFSRSTKALMKSEDIINE